jgi:hypothetical protein
MALVTHIREVHQELCRGLLAVPHQQVPTQWAVQHWYYLSQGSCCSPSYFVTPSHSYTVTPPDDLLIMGP